MPCQLAWLSNSALTIARLPCCSRFLLLKSMGRSRKGRNPAHAGGLHISPHKVQEGTLDLLLLHTPSRRECTSTCAYGHPNACAGWVHLGQVGRRAELAQRSLGPLLKSFWGDPHGLGSLVCWQQDGRRQEANVSPQPSAEHLSGFPSLFFFLFSLYIVCCRNYSCLCMNDLVPLLARLRVHPSRRKLPTNPAALAQTQALSMRSWQQRVTPEPTASPEQQPARKVSFPLPDPLNWLLIFSVVPAGLQHGQPQPARPLMQALSAAKSTEAVQPLKQLLDCAHEYK